MATSYKSTIHVRSWKEHTCSSCGAAFAYLLDRKIAVSASSAEKAGAKAQAKAQRALEHDVDWHPCPSCGLVQPEMIGQRQARRHLQVFWLAAIACAGILMMRLGDGFQTNEATNGLLAVAAVAVVVHAFIDRWNANRRMDANRAAGERQVAAGALHRTGDATSAPTPLARPLSTLQLFALLMLAAAPLFVAGPELTRAARDWPLNPACYPPVVGPGDTTKIYMAGSISSIHGYWRGRTTATLTGGGQDAVMQAYTNQSDWGSTIQAKDSEKSQTSFPWVQVTVPNRADLAGQSLQAKIHLDVEFPHMAGPTTFETQKSSMERALAMRLSPAGAGARYESSWWIGSLGGVGLLLVAGLLLRLVALAFERQGHPTRVFAVEQA